MGLTKKDRLNSTYDAFINVALRQHPIIEISGHIDDRFMAYGTANDEKIFGLDGFMWMVERQWEEMDISRTKVKQHPITRHFFNGDDSAMIVEEIEILVHEDEETEPMSFRLSTLLEYNGKKWMILHFHGSIGDANTLEGNAWPIQELKRRNIELEQQVAEKTADLVQHKRELEIEAALERVRTRTLLMKDSGELNEAVAVFFQQFQQLDLLPTEARTYFCKINEVNRVAEVWMTKADGKVMSGSHHTPLDKSPSLVKYFDAWVSKEPYIVRNYSGNELKEYLSFVSSLPHVKTDKDYQKIFKSPPDRIVMTDATFQQGCIGVMTFEPLSTEALDILVRFAKVFEFTYTRFLDLQKAESQAREAQIETSLERVRAAAMAMHKSEDLPKVSDVLYKEFELLGLTQSATCGFVIVDEKEQVQHAYGSPASKNFLEYFKLPLLGDAVLKNRYEAWKQTKPVFHQKVGGSKLKKHMDFVMPVEILTEEVRISQQSMPDPTYFYFGNFSQGYLQVLASDALFEEQVELIPRFAKVFEQAYTRFLDLQKAEEQAREAEIEVALERLRARSMGMHHTTELIEVVRLLDREIKGLGIQNVDATQIFTDLSDPYEGVNVWVKVEEMDYLKKFHVPYIDQPVISNLFEEFKKKENFYTEKYSKAENNRLFKLLFKYSDFKSIPKERQSVLLNSPGLVRSSVILKNSALIFQHNGLEEFSEEDNAIFKRFGVVFEQAYTRFLDLQKAEEQAREAQIEASLERVRAKAMAMHNSKDIESATAVVFNELSRLGIDLERCGITLMNETPVAELWSTALSHDNKEVIDIVTGYLDFRIHPLTQKTYRDWKEKKKFSTYYLVGEELKKYYDKLEKQPEYKFPKVGSYPDQQVLHSFFFNAGAIFVYTTTELSNESKKIVHRFTKVFEQTYTRFLDLQKAEEQAREAQIEAALERVRARSMAMQKTDELHDVLSVLFDQFYLLGIEPANVFLSLFNREDRTLTYRATGTGGSRTQGQQVVSLDSLDVWRELFEKWKNDNSDSVEVVYYEKEILPTLFGLLEETFSAMPENERLSMDHFPDGGYTAHGYTPFGYIGFNHTRMPTNEEKEILTRFASEFSRVYQRFLDIEKAEAQARESEIQLAVEKVRARSMAMHHSSELFEVARLLDQEIKGLGIHKVDATQIGTDLSKPEEGLNVWIKVEEMNYLKKFHIPFIDHPVLHNLAEAYKKKENFYTENYSKAEKNRFFKLIFKYSDLKSIPEERKEVLLNSSGLIRSTVVHKNSALIFHHNGLDEFSDEDNAIFKRFGVVFEQAYTRFMDLQKAEEQARESEIQLALERVRARTMAMHNSNELGEVASILFEQISLLTSAPDRFNIAIANEADESFNIFITDQNGFQIKNTFNAEAKGSPVLAEAFENWKNDASHLLQDIHGKELENWILYMGDIVGVPFNMKKVKEHRFLSSVFFSHGFIGITTHEEPDSEIIHLLKRFSKVFQQTYTRFLDLQKAEEQAREAQIEAALERVRSRSLAMHKTDELQDVVRVVAEELKNTGVILDTGGAVICTYFQDSKDVIHWTASEDPAHPSVPYLVPYFEDELFDEAWASKNRGDDYFAKEFSYDVKNAFFNHAFKQSDYRQLPDEYKKVILESDSHGLAWAWSENSAIMIPSIQGDLPSEEDMKILIRFAKVFEQSFIRFLDLQKAEKQAREAKIETALEKVRSRTMGMQSSEELPEVANLMFLEVQALGIPAWSCGYCILLDDGKSSTCIMSSEGTLQKPFMLPHSGEASFNEWDDFVQSDETFFTQELGGKAIESHYNFMKSLPQLTPVFKELEEAELSLPTYQINHLCKISHGFLLFITYEPVPDAHDIFKRFTNVFEQTYTRFLDLKKAEKLALETARQSSLDRIRAEIGSMRSADDLNQITPIIWDELKTLGIPFIRCGVFIIDEEKGISHTYLSTSQGDPIAALHLPLGDIPLVKNAVASWKHREIYTEHWEIEDFREWTQNLIDRGFIESKKKYEAGSAPETLDLHFLPFKHGMLYIGNTEPLPQKKLDLGQSMAKAFSVAYDRYEDFNKLELAFRELEAAKDQLVQQEKLASLGQLTAGIAHEIKNPLNFVNNFSDLSIELVEEAREELSAFRRQLLEGRENSPLEGSAEAERRRGVSDEATNHALILDILDNIETNLKIIHKHGTRADGIVKSMLQHSRGGSGKMEATDINALIKEYSNLAFHGMRAGKDPINVDIKLDLDETVGEVELIGEDFSRVILNLCNNAFDAMREKALSPNPSPEGEGRRGEGEYSPKLTVRTHKKDTFVIIQIQDNGPGIPVEIKDKILQPFFTTKKGTAGTGLGLSITNDIVKAHGGSIEIISSETGTLFNIFIPSS